MDRTPSWGAAAMGTILAICGAASAQNAIARITVNSAGVEANGRSVQPGLSADGKLVVFSSSASNLVPGDNNDVADVFLYDRAARTFTRVSEGAGGKQADEPCFAPAISADGRFVAYWSCAATLVAGHAGKEADVFVYDRTTRTTTCLTTGGNGPSGLNQRLAISADGRFVALASLAGNLVGDDTNDAWDIFVCDRQSGVTTRVSVGPGGAQANGNSFAPAISGDGRYVAFHSFASNLVAGDTNNQPDVLVYDRTTRTTTRISAGADGAQSDGQSLSPSISADGRFVAFVSQGTGAAGGQGSGVVLCDRQTRKTVQLAAGRACIDPVISGNGQVVAWCASGGDEGSPTEVFVYDAAKKTTARLSSPAGGAAADGSSFGAALSFTGQVAAFASDGSNLTAGDKRGFTDVFLVDRQPAAARQQAAAP
jgi:Tol biopolymer transport system component